MDIVSFCNVSLLSSYCANGSATIVICNYAGEYSEISSIFSGTTYTAEMVGGGYVEIVDFL